MAAGLQAPAVEMVEAERAPRVPASVMRRGAARGSTEGAAHEQLFSAAALPYPASARWIQDAYLTLREATGVMEAAPHSRRLVAITPLRGSHDLMRSRVAAFFTAPAKSPRYSPFHRSCELNLD